MLRFWKALKICSGLLLAWKKSIHQKPGCVLSVLSAFTWDGFHSVKQRCYLNSRWSKIMGFIYLNPLLMQKKIKIMQCPVAPCGEGDGTRRFSRVFSSDLSSGRAAGSWALLLPFLFCITLLLELPFWKCFFFLECPQAWVRGEHLVVQQDPEGRVVFCSLRCAQLRAACHMSPKYTRSICSLVCWPGICTCAKPALS